MPSVDGDPTQRSVQRRDLHRPLELNHRARVGGGDSVSCTLYNVYVCECNIFQACLVHKCMRGGGKCIIHCVSVVGQVAQ